MRGVAELKVLVLNQPDMVLPRLANPDDRAPVFNAPERPDPTPVTRLAQPDDKAPPR